MLGRDEWIGIHLEHVHFVVVRQPHVHAAVVLQPECVKRGAADLANAPGQLLRHSFGEHVLDLFFLAVIFVPLGLVRRDAMLGGLGLTERHFREWQDFQVVVADQPDIDLASLDQLFDDRGLMVFAVDELDALLETGVVFHDRRLRDADRGVLEQRLHDEWKPQLGRPHEGVAFVELGECRNPDAVECEDFLGERFVPGDEQGGGRRAGVAIAVHVEQRGDGVLVPRVLAEAFTAVEDKLGLKARQLAQERRDVVADADHQYVVVVRDQRAGDVVLRFFGLLLYGALEGGVIPIRVQRVEDHGDLHDGLTARRTGGYRESSRAACPASPWSTR